MKPKATWTVLAVVSCAIVAAGHLLASNMGFKLNYRLNANASVGGVGSGKNTLALPYFRQAGVNTASELQIDIGSGSINPVLNVSQFLEATDTFRVYTGRRSPSPSFSLVAGEGYFVSMASNVNYIVVGAHDPSLAVQLDAPGPGSATGKNLVALPYNVNSANAFELMQDIGGGLITPVLSVARFEAATDTYLSYTGRMGSPSLTPFPIKMGEAYFIIMATTVPYIPSHF